MRRLKLLNGLDGSVLSSTFLADLYDNYTVAVPSVNPILFVLNSTSLVQHVSRHDFSFILFAVVIIPPKWAAMFNVFLCVWLKSLLYKVQPLTPKSKYWSVLLHNNWIKFCFCTTGDVGTDLVLLLLVSSTSFLSTVMFLYYVACLPDILGVIVCYDNSTASRRPSVATGVFQTLRGFLL